MKKPQTVGAFKELILGMAHRERFVFQVKYGGNLEVYCTIKFQMQEAPENISLIITDVNGNKKNTTNKLLKLWSDSYFEQIYSHLI